METRACNRELCLPRHRIGRLVTECCVVMICSVYETRATRLDAAGKVHIRVTCECKDRTSPARAQTSVTEGGRSSPGSGRCVGQTSLELELDHLAGRVPGQRVNEEELARHLVVGQVL